MVTAAVPLQTRRRFFNLDITAVSSVVFLNDDAYASSSGAKPSRQSSQRSREQLVYEGNGTRGVS